MYLHRGRNGEREEGRGVGGTWHGRGSDTMNIFNLKYITHSFLWSLYVSTELLGRCGVPRGANENACPLSKKVGCVYVAWVGVAKIARGG